MCNNCNRPAPKPRDVAYDHALRRIGGTHPMTPREYLATVGSQG